MIDQQTPQKHPGRNISKVNIVFIVLISIFFLFIMISTGIELFPLFSKGQFSTAVVDLLAGDYALISIAILVFNTSPSGKAFASFPLFTAAVISFVSTSRRLTSYAVIWPGSGLKESLLSGVSFFSWNLTAIMFFMLAWALVMAFILSPDKNKSSSDTSKTPVKAFVLISLAIIASSFTPFVIDFANDANSSSPQIEQEQGDN